MAVVHQATQPEPTDKETITLGTHLSFEALDQLNAELLPERAMLGGVAGGAGAAGASSSSAASGGAVGGGGGVALTSCAAVVQPAPSVLSLLGLATNETIVTCVPGAVGTF